MFQGPHIKLIVLLSIIAIVSIADDDDSAADR